MKFDLIIRSGLGITQGDVPRLYRRRVVTNFSAAGDNPPLSYMMHTRAERKMLPSRQPARGAAARFASLESPFKIFVSSITEFYRKNRTLTSPVLMFTEYEE